MNLLCLGDSITSSYPAGLNRDSTLYGTYPGGNGDAIGLKVWSRLRPRFAAVVIAAGIGYTMVSDVGGAGNIVTLEVDPILAQGSAADTVVLQGGINDLAYGQTSDALIAGIKARAGALMAKPFAKVVLWTVTPHGAFALPGQVEEPRVTSHGSGYTSRPDLVITGSGTGADARAVLLGDQVLRTGLIAGGSGYSGAVNVAISGGGGSGAVAVSQVSDGGYTGGMADGTWTAQKETYRQAVNAWIRSSAVSEGYAHLVYDPEALGFTDPTGPLWDADMVHYTEAGNELHARNLAYLIAPNRVGTGVGSHRGSRP